MSIPSLAEIVALEETLHRPEVRRCRQTVENLIAEDFMEIGASGKIYDRRAIIELLAKEPALPDDVVKSMNYSLKMISEGSVLLTYETERIHADGLQRRAARSSIWVQTGSKWQMLFHQATIRLSFS
ncbi:DUF4440 domain-containing protein [Rhizobium sp. AQ_MP]|uniref:nuclear transport factor 2 family protein n=1 Tax=Rhizobium sp. AQ_MP TaxID=2761536 RepID=UPI001FED7BE0|nr:DUF4440 domain-containing protein [Rhizobium sp. AQ_MP]